MAVSDCVEKNCSPGSFITFGFSYWSQLKDFCIVCTLYCVTALAPLASQCAPVLLLVASGDRRHCRAKCQP